MSATYGIVRMAGTSATIPNLLRGKRVKLQSQNTSATSPLVRTDRKPVTIQDSLPRKPRCSLMLSTNVITQLAEEATVIAIPLDSQRRRIKIGRASCRERV